MGSATGPGALRPDLVGRDLTLRAHLRPGLDRGIEGFPHSAKNGEIKFSSVNAVKR